MKHSSQHNYELVMDMCGTEYLCKVNWHMARWEMSPGEYTKGEVTFPLDSCVYGNEF